jgi:hypothetical protein
VRTVLSLDDDVARLLDKETRKSGASFKETVNHFLRLGLMAGKRPLRKQFVVVPRKLKLPAGQSYDNIEQLLDQWEGPAPVIVLDANILFSSKSSGI